MKCSLSFEVTVQKVWHTQCWFNLLIFLISIWTYLDNIVELSFAKIKHTVGRKQCIWYFYDVIWVIYEVFYMTEFHIYFEVVSRFLVSLSCFHNNRSQSSDCFHSILFFHSFQPSQWLASHCCGPGSVIVDKVALWRVLLLILWFPTVSIIPPMFHNLFHLHVALTRTNKWSLDTFQAGSWWALDRN
jgi:hypothetical protein